MTWPGRRPVNLDPPADQDQLRPLYARVLRLRHVDPGGVLCFVFFEGSLAVAVLLALAELVTWWAVLVLPVSVAVMVKLNDVVAASTTRAVTLVPAIEQERFRRELRPAIGRAPVPRTRQGGAAPASFSPAQVTGPPTTADPAGAPRPSVVAGAARTGRSSGAGGSSRAPRQWVVAGAAQPSRPPVGAGSFPTVSSSGWWTVLLYARLRAGFAGWHRSSGGEPGTRFQLPSGGRPLAGLPGRPGSAAQLVLRAGARGGQVPVAGPEGRATDRLRHDEPTGPGQSAPDRTTNAHFPDRMDPLSVRRWMRRMYGTDNAQQRARQSARRRYR